MKLLQSCKYDQGKLIFSSTSVLSVWLMEDFFFLQCRHKNLLCKCKAATSFSQKTIPFSSSCILLLVNFILSSQGVFLPLGLRMFFVLANWKLFPVVEYISMV